MHNQPTAGAKTGFCQEIQALRGIAVLMTFCAHAPGVFPQFQPLMVIHFWTGVDLFLTISGFVIAKSFFPQILQQEDKLFRFKMSVAFWIRRAYRLLPASLFWAFFLLFAAMLFNQSGIFATRSDVLKEVFAVMLYAKNIASAYGINFSLGPYWSLSLEEQFYFVLPLLLIFVPRLLDPRIYLPLVLLLAMFPQLLGPHHGLFRFESFMIGIFIYQLHQTPFRRILEPLFMRAAYKRVVVTGGLLVVMMLVPTLLGYFPGYTFFVLVASGLLVFFASYDQGFLHMGNLSNQIAGWLGDRSYSVYVCHMPALLLVYELGHRYFGIEFNKVSTPQAAVGVAMAFVLTLVFASVSYLLLEKPWQISGKRVAAQYLERISAVR